MSEIGWMAGVFRQRKHWVSDITRNFQHEYGITYYAACGSPCLDASELRRLWWPWDTCAICATTLMPDVEWWFGPLRDATAHVRVSEVLAVCGSVITEQVPDIAKRYDLSGCGSCLAELIE